MNEPSEGVRDLRAIRPAGAFDRALEAGLASNPPRLLDPLFHRAKGLHLRDVLEASGTTRARAVEADRISALLGPQDIVNPPQP